MKKDRSKEQIGRIFAKLQEEEKDRRFKDILDRLQLLQALETVRDEVWGEGNYN